jgi:hypothetical protein
LWDRALFPGRRAEPRGVGWESQIESGRWTGLGAAGLNQAELRSADGRVARPPQP